MNQPLQSGGASHTLNRVTNVVIALVLLLFVFYAIDSWQKVKAREDQHMESILVLMARTLDTYFLSKQAGMLTLAEAIDKLPGGPGNRAGMQHLLEDYKKHRQDISLAFVTDMRGQFLASSHTRELGPLPSIGEQPSFQVFLSEYDNTRGVYLGRPQLGMLTGQWAFSLRYVLRDRTGKGVAVLTDVFPTDFLVSVWREVPLVERLVVGIMRDDGYLLSRYPLPTTLRKEDVFGKPRTGALYSHLKQHDFPWYGRVTGPTALSGGDDFVNVFYRLESFPATAFVAQPAHQIVYLWFAGIGTPLVMLILLLVSIKLVSWKLVEQARRSEAERMAADAALRASEAEQRFLIDNLMTGVVVHDAAGAVLRCNNEASKLLGLSFEQMTGKHLIDPAWRFLNEDGSTMAVTDYPASRVLTTRQPVKDLVAGIVKSEGADICWVLCRADPWISAAGQLDQIVVTFVDITMRRKLTSELEDRELKFKALFENSMDAVLLTVPDGRVLAVNRAACQLFGLSEAQIIAKGRAGLTDPADPRLQELLAKRSATGRAAGLLTMVRGDGSRFTAEITSSIYEDSQGGRYSSMILRDMSERLRSQAELEAANTEMRRINEQLAEVAHFDMLTHLPNRVLLSDRLQQAMAQSARRDKSVGIAFLDLDGFKDINDRYGHATGDEFLVAIARRLKSVLRDGDTLARIGGDEFVAVMTDLANEQDCEPLLRRLLQVAAEPVQIDGHPLQVSASIGVTLYPTDSSSSEQLVRHADQAMYLAKQAGKNRYHVFDVVNDAAIRTKRESLEQIKAAYRRREFVLFYQPQVNMESGEVVGVEALIRWLHPQRGLLGPGIFLPVIEDQELAIAIGEMVMEMALVQMEQWQGMGLPLPVSVNVFSRQLQQEDFVRKLQALLAAHPSVPPERLELEIVETSALQDIPQVSSLMHACAELGVRFALDDFGTGYSSLTYLKKLPAQLLKIDQSFVRDMLEDRDDLAIVEGVIGLSRAFNRKVIAEGVETVAHGRMLLSLGCTLGQGYGIARPMPAADLPRWLSQWQAQQPWAKRLG
jgi:diguanylate cyclase (GGDEF)-like protein/PAS domain S-box-containing protein